MLVHSCFLGSRHQFGVDGRLRWLHRVGEFIILYKSDFIACAFKSGSVAHRGNVSPPGLERGGGPRVRVDPTSGDPNRVKSWGDPTNMKQSLD